MLVRGRGMRLRQGSTINTRPPVAVRAPFTDGASLILRPFVDTAAPIVFRTSPDAQASFKLTHGCISGYPSRITGLYERSVKFAQPVLLRRSLCF
jgi:hypothetical protein